MNWFDQRKSKGFGAKVKKYGNNTRSVCGLNHPHRSQLETAVCNQLQLRMRAGEITDLITESRVKLTKHISYYADFKFKDAATGADRWAEAKGYETPEWRLKLNLWREFGPGPLEIYKGSAVRFQLTETVIPERAP